MKAVVSGARGLEGKVVVVTGAARGIGRAAAEQFLAAGAQVVALDRSYVGAEEVVAGWEGTGGVLAETLDVTDKAAVAAGCGATLDRFGRVDVLVNNAALRQRELFPPDGVVDVLATTDADWEAMLAVNLFGTLTMTRCFVAPMLEAGQGSVINVGTRGSVLTPAGPGAFQGAHPGFRNQPYDASKAAMCSLSLYLAEEVRGRGVAVNVVFPGPTWTTGSEKVAEGRRRRGIDERPFLRPEHMAPLLLALALEPAATGTTGRAIDALQWNRDHGFGDVDEWWYRP